MQGTDHVNWMLSAALGTLPRAERMHQHFLKLLPRDEGDVMWECAQAALTFVKTR